MTKLVFVIAAVVCCAVLSVEQNLNLSALSTNEGHSILNDQQNIAEDISSKNKNLSLDFDASAYSDRTGSGQMSAAATNPSYYPIHTPPSQRPTIPGATHYPTFGWPTYSPLAAGSTYAPSSSSLMTNIHAEQVVEGISYTNYLGCAGSCDAALKSAISACMSDTTMYNVEYLVITPFDPSNPYGDGRRLQAVATVNNSITITYTVYTYYGASFTQLSNELTTAISSGLFDEYLGGYAVTWSGALALQGTTSTLLYTSGNWEPPFYDGYDDTYVSDNLSSGAIAGIVIAVVIFVTLSGFLVWYYMYRSTTRNGMAATNSMGVAAMSAADHKSSEAVNPLSSSSTAQSSAVQTATSSSDVEMADITKTINKTELTTTGVLSGEKEKEEGGVVGDENI